MAIKAACDTSPQLKGKGKDCHLCWDSWAIWKKWGKDFKKNKDLLELTSSEDEPEEEEGNDRSASKANVSVVEPCERSSA